MFWITTCLLAGSPPPFLVVSPKFLVLMAVFTFYLAKFKFNYILLLTSLLWNTCMRIPFVSRPLKHIYILLNWNQCHNLRAFFILNSVSSNIHHARPLSPFERRRATTLAMVLVKLFLHAAWDPWSLRLHWRYIIRFD